MSISSACGTALPAPDDPGRRWWRACWRPARWCWWPAPPRPQPARRSGDPGSPLAAAGTPAENALPGDPRWRITIPVISTARGFHRPDRRAARHLVPAVRVDHGAQLPGSRVPDGLVRRRPGPPGADLTGYARPLPAEGEDRPAGIDGGRALAPSLTVPTQAGRLVRICCGWTPRRGCRATCRW